MARLPYVDPGAASPANREALEAVPPLNIFRMLAHADTAFRPWLRWGAALLGTLELDPVLRELAILRVARLTPHAEYEWVQHVPIFEAVGGRPEQVAALERDGFVLSRQSGSHRHYKHADGRRVTVTFHHTSDTFRFKTLRSMIEVQAQWREEDLVRLQLV